MRQKQRVCVGFVWGFLYMQSEKYTVVNKLLQCAFSPQLICCYTSSGRPCLSLSFFSGNEIGINIMLSFKSSA